MLCAPRPPTTPICPFEFLTPGPGQPTPDEHQIACSEHHRLSRPRSPCATRRAPAPWRCNPTWPNPPVMGVGDTGRTPPTAKDRRASRRRRLRIRNDAARIETCVGEEAATRSECPNHHGRLSTALERPGRARFTIDPRRVRKAIGAVPRHTVPFTCAARQAAGLLG
jgi:hypothetical protein